MATETMSDRRQHVRSISVTALSTLLGVGAGLASATYVGTHEAAATDPRAYVIVLAVILIQFPLLTGTGIYDDDEFGVKHYLFIAFMTFSMWFVTWGILLTAHAHGG